MGALFSLHAPRSGAPPARVPPGCLLPPAVRGSAWESLPASPDECLCPRARAFLFAVSFPPLVHVLRAVLQRGMGRAFPRVPAGQRAGYRVGGRGVHSWPRTLHLLPASKVTRDKSECPLMAVILFGDFFPLASGNCAPRAGKFHSNMLGGSTLSLALGAWSLSRSDTRPSPGRVGFPISGASGGPPPPMSSSSTPSLLFSFHSGSSGPASQRLSHSRERFLSPLVHSSRAVFCMNV